VIGGIVIFVLGFFMGREHMKYTIMSSFTQAFSEFGQSLGNPSDATNSDVEEEATTAPEQEPVTMKVLSKDTTKNSYDNGIDTIETSVEFTNATGKDIRAFTGVMHFMDLFDRTIKDVSMTYEKELKAGETKTWDASIDYNQFMESDMRLATVDLNSMKSSLTVREVIFADGTREKY
jgi:hypothetical protein